MTGGQKWLVVHAQLARPVPRDAAVFDVIVGLRKRASTMDPPDPDGWTLARPTAARHSTRSVSWFGEIALMSSGFIWQGTVRIGPVRFERCATRSRPPPTRSPSSGGTHCSGRRRVPQSTLPGASTCAGPVVDVEVATETYRAEVIGLSADDISVIMQRGLRPAPQLHDYVANAAAGRFQCPRVDSPLDTKDT